MKISSRFTVAIHVLSVLSLKQEDLCTSDKIAESVKTNPVVIRRVMGLLKKAKLINVKKGCGGACLLKPMEDITLFDIYRAVEVVDEGKLFQIHKGSNENCMVGANIQHILEDILLKAQVAMEDVLKAITLKDINSSIVEKCDS